MFLLKRITGHFLYGFTKLVDVLFNIIIGIIETAVTLVSNLAKGFVALVGMGGCLLLLMFMGPFGLFLLFHPMVLLSILLFIVFPILGTKFVSYLKYRRYMITEYLFDLANYLIEGKGRNFKSFHEYGNKYRRMEEEKRREEWRKRQEQQQRQWEERFRQWYEYQNRQAGSYGGQSGSWWHGQGAGYGGGQTYMDPTAEFKNKYEESCDLLGVPYNADKYQIKLAYRKKAKEYHPDLNKAPDATEKFQKINDAYEFLSDANIERYKTLR